MTSRPSSCCRRSLIVAYVASVTDRSASADKERAAFDPQMIRSETGLGAEVAAAPTEGSAICVKDGPPGLLPAALFLYDRNSRASKRSTDRPANLWIDRVRSTPQRGSSPRCPSPATLAQANRAPISLLSEHRRRPVRRCAASRIAVRLRSQSINAIAIRVALRHRAAARATARGELRHKPGGNHEFDSPTGCSSLSAELQDRGAPGHLRLVTRHRLRVVRLLPLRDSRPVLRRIVLSQGQRDGCLAVGVRDLCGRIPRPSVRRAGVRPDRRFGRPQVHLPGHDRRDGLVDLRRRPAPDVPDDRLGRTRPAREPAPGAGPRAWRRIRRRSHLRSRACATESARLRYRLDPDHGHRWACSWRSS